MVKKTPNTPNVLSAAQYTVLVTIAEYVRQYKVPPTHNELASRLGIAQNAASQSIAILRRKGMLATSPGRFRNITITYSGRIAVKSPRSN